MILSASGQEISAPLSALEIAKVRYARGEITREEYLHLSDDLR
jgi:uncharacterized membrane protein